jgi:hypothetical protein
MRRIVKPSSLSSFSFSCRNAQKQPDGGQDSSAERSNRGGSNKAEHAASVRELNPLNPVSALARDS